MLPQAPPPVSQSATKAQPIVQMPSSKAPCVRALAATAGVENYQVVSIAELSAKRESCWHSLREDGGVVFFDNVTVEPEKPGDAEGRPLDALQEVAFKPGALALVESVCRSSMGHEAELPVTFVSFRRSQP